MRRNIIIILFYFCSCIAAAQDLPIIKNTYQHQSFSDFARKVQASEDIRIYFRDDWTDSLNIVKIDAGMSLDVAMNKILEGTELRSFIEGRSVYIYKGKPIITVVPDYSHSVSHNLTNTQELKNADSVQNKYLQTKNISENNFITIGSRQYAENGNSYLVEGNIKNRETGEALIGATIIIKETGAGTIADAKGNFSLKLPAGIYHLVVNHMAMKDAEYGLNVLSGGKFNIELDNNLIELEEITLVNKRQSNVKGMLMGFERISLESVKEIPAVLGEKDVLKVAQMLPGVQNAGEGSSGFNVRGGSADQNMFYINKISVYNTSHLFGFFTAFSPDIISDFSLYKNNVPSKYGGRIASIFEITTRQGNKNNFFVQGGLSPITGHISAEGPVIKDKVTFVASWRSTYSDWILKKMNDLDLRNSNASFYDGTIGINADVNAKNQLKFFFYKSSDSFSLSVRNDYQYSNTGASLSLKHSFSSALTADFSFASSNYNFSTIDKNNISEAYHHAYYINHSEARADFLSLKYDNHRIEYGVSSILYKLDRGDILPYGPESRRVPIELGLERGTENAIYLSDEFRIAQRLNLLLGIRYSLYGLLGPEEVHLYNEGLPINTNNISGTLNFGNGELIKSYSGFEPRAALNYTLNPNTSLKASYNRLKQYIFLLSNTIAIAPNDQWKLTDYHIAPPVSDQVSIGFYHDFSDPLINFSVEVYKKWVNNVVEYKDGADFISEDPLETQILQGKQDSHGIEFMVKKNADKLTGWLSYTLARSTILIDGISSEMKVNNGIPYPSNFDRPHSFNLVANYRVSRRLSFSSNVVYSTGRPVTLPVAAYYAEDRPYLLYSSRNAYRIPDYFRVDFSVNLEGNLKFKKLAHSYWMLNVYNMTGRHNAYSVFYEVEDGAINGYQLSVFARSIITLSWNFKFGNYNSN